MVLPHPEGPSREKELAFLQSQVQVPHRGEGAEPLFHAGDFDDVLSGHLRILHQADLAERRRKYSAVSSNSTEASSKSEPSASVFGSLAGKRIWLQI